MVSHLLYNSHITVAIVVLLPCHVRTQHAGSQRILYLKKMEKAMILNGGICSSSCDLQ